MEKTKFGKKNKQILQGPMLGLKHGPYHEANADAVADMTGVIVFWNVSLKNTRQAQPAVLALQLAGAIARITKWWTVAWARTS